MPKAVKAKATVVKNVGELISALQQFPKDMKIDVDVERTVAVFQMKPAKGEVFEDKRGYVKIMGLEQQ